MRKYYIKEDGKKINNKERISFDNSQYLHAIDGTLAKIITE
jgi:hypothetical protein